MVIPADTLRPDSALLATLRADSRYDYARELVPSQTSLWDIVTNWLGKILDNISNSIDKGDYTFLFVTIAIFVIVGVSVAFYLKNPQLFSRNKKVKAEQEDEEDNIYGVDFDKEIAAAKKKGNWRRVVRLIYLQTLRTLSDSKRIYWRPSKTPTQYTYEVKTDEFREMTRQFLRVRYGGFSADEAMAEQMKALQKVVTEPVKTNDKQDNPEAKQAAKKGNADAKQGKEAKE